MEPWNSCICGYCKRDGRTNALLKYAIHELMNANLVAYILYYLFNTKLKFNLIKIFHETKSVYDIYFYYNNFNTEILIFKLFHG